MRSIKTDYTHHDMLSVKIFKVFMSSFFNEDWFHSILMFQVKIFKVHTYYFFMIPCFSYYMIIQQATIPDRVE